MKASGVYRYRRDGKTQDIVEPWQVDREAEGWQLTGQRVLDGTKALDVEARYRGARCTTMRVSWLASTKPRDATLVAPADALLFPLLRVAASPLLPLLAQGPRAVVVPDIRDPRSADFLAPLHSTRHAVRQTDDARHYRYYGGEYGEAGADYWLDENGLVARYRWQSPQGEWEACLEEFSLTPGLMLFSVTS